MTESTFEHSEEWFEKLTHTIDELPPSERDAIAKHVASCPDCYRILADNTTLERFIQALPAPDFPPGLGPKLLALWKEEDWQRMKDLGYL
jgi:hypothetical protein